MKKNLLFLSVLAFSAISSVKCDKLEELTENINTKSKIFNKDLKLGITQSEKKDWEDVNFEINKFIMSNKIPQNIKSELENLLTKDRYLNEAALRWIENLKKAKGTFFEQNQYALKDGIYYFKTRHLNPAIAELERQIKFAQEKITLLNQEKDINETLANKLVELLSKWVNVYTKIKNKLESDWKAYLAAQEAANR